MVPGAHSCDKAPMTRTAPFRPADDIARTLAGQLLSRATHAALATVQAGTLHPSVTRIALATDLAGQPVTLISTLAPHTHSLLATPECALLVGDPGEKGDPLTHPRLTLHARAQFVARDSADHPALRAHYLKLRPKAKLYVDFADFGFVRFQITEALLNGGFGKAWRMAPRDIMG